LVGKCELIPNRLSAGQIKLESVERQNIFPERQNIFPERQNIFPERQNIFPERQNIFPEHWIIFRTHWKISQTDFISLSSFLNLLPLRALRVLRGAIPGPRQRSALPPSHPTGPIYLQLNEG
jgi:hypothetical protein